MTRLFFLSPATPVANDKSSIITTVCNIQTRDLSSNEENYISDCMFNSLPSTLIQCSVLQTQTANEEQKHTSALSESINRYGFKIKYIRSIPRASVRLPVSDANVHVCVCIHACMYTIQFFLPLLLRCVTEISFIFLLMCYTACFLAWLAWYSFISLSLSAELPFLCVSEKAFAFQWCVSNSFTPLVQLVLLARKQSKYNCSLSSPPRHWFIHSLLQLGATNLRGSQLIHRTKI